MGLGQNSTVESLISETARPPQQEYWHDMKFWWPQCEAIIATLYAYEVTGDRKYLECTG